MWSTITIIICFIGIFAELYEEDTENLSKTREITTVITGICLSLIIYIIASKLI